MTEDEARRVEQALALAGLAGLPGRAAPADPDERNGAWRIVDDAGKDITLASLDALLEWMGGTTGAAPAPGWHNGRPVRGFVFTDSGQD